MMITTDVLIIGGGIAGCIAATALGERYQVTLIDKRAEPLDKIGESLAPAAQRILTTLGLLKGLDEAERQFLYFDNQGMQSYWGSSQRQIKDHLRNPDGFVKNINRKAFESYLRKTTRQRGVQGLWPLQFVKANYEDQYWYITTQNNDNTTQSTICAKLVIDATGRPAHFARHLGIRRQSYDKLLSCWISFADNSLNKMSSIAACPTGWWYSACLPQKRRILAFQTDADLLQRAQSKHLEAFLELARENPIARPILALADSPIQFHGTTSANSTHLLQVVGQQWLALGDAALGFDPLSSQGMFHAMASAMQVRNLLKQFDIVNDLTMENMLALAQAYSQQINNIWQRYLAHKNLFYRLEQRWKEELFWTRR